MRVLLNNQNTKKEGDVAIGKIIYVTLVSLIGIAGSEASFLLHGLCIFYTMLVRMSLISHSFLLGAGTAYSDFTQIESLL